MGPVKDDLDENTFYGAFQNVAEAEELVAVFQKAIERAHLKTEGRPLFPLTIYGLNSFQRAAVRCSQ